MLERSKAALPNIFMDERSTNLLHLVLSHLSRMESLTVTEWPNEKLQEMHTIIETNLLVAPRLTTLSINSYDRGPTSWFMPSTTPMQTNYLQNLFLDNIYLDWVHSPILRNLRSLRVTSLQNDCRPTWSDLMTALRRMPSLEILDLVDALPIHSAPSSLPCHPMPSLKHLVLQYPPSLEAVINFLDLVKLPRSLEVLTVSDVANPPDIIQLRDLFRSIQKALPYICSNAKYMNVMHQSMTGERRDSGIILLECFATLQDNFATKWYEELHYKANIGLELAYDSLPLREIMLVDALCGHELPHTMCLRVGEFIEHADLLAVLGRLSELQLIQVFGQATEQLFQALEILQDCVGRNGPTILRKLTEVRISDDCGLAGPMDCIISDNAWQKIQYVLAQRKSR